MISKVEVILCTWDVTYLRKALSANWALILLAKNSHPSGALITKRMITNANRINFNISKTNYTSILRVFVFLFCVQVAFNSLHHLFVTHFQILDLWEKFINQRSHFYFSKGSENVPFHYQSKNFLKTTHLQFTIQIRNEHFLSRLNNKQIPKEKL